MISGTANRLGAGYRETTDRLSEYRCFPSATHVRAGAVNRYSDDQSLFSSHRLAIVIPVRVLARDPPVVVLQDRQRVRQVDELRASLGLNPLAEETVVDDTQGRPRVPGQVPGLDGGLPGADQRAAVVVDGDEHGGELRAPV